MVITRFLMEISTKVSKGALDNKLTLKCYIRSVYSSFENDRIKWIIVNAKLYVCNTETTHTDVLLTNVSCRYIEKQ